MIRTFIYSTSCAAFLVLTGAFTSRLLACGYNFVGGCSSSLNLHINGTLDSFAVAACPFGKYFNGMHFRKVRSLRLAQARATTWESCINNVTGMTLRYRIYEQGKSPGSWRTLTMPEKRTTIEGPYTTRARVVNPDLDLASGLPVGKTYMIETWFRAEIDTIGDDFIPETALVQDNDGRYYKAAFDYVGPTGPPFSISVTQKKDPACPGDSTGVIGVSVYGDQTNLFYKWSAFPQNFSVQSRLPGGKYRVIVTGAGGRADTSEVIELKTPLPIRISAIVQHATGAAKNDGALTLSFSGGKSPYTLTSNTTEPLERLRPGNYCFTVTDAAGCKKDTCFRVNVTSSATASDFEAAGARIWPNPAAYPTPLTVELPAAWSGQADFRIDWVDLQGRRLATTLPFRTAEQQWQVDMPARLSPGMYLLRVISGTRHGVFRVVVE